MRVTKMASCSVKVADHRIDQGKIVRFYRQEKFVQVLLFGVSNDARFVEIANLIPFRVLDGRAEYLSKIIAVLGKHFHDALLNVDLSDAKVILIGRSSTGTLKQ